MDCCESWFKTVSQQYREKLRSQSLMEWHLRTANLYLLAHDAVRSSKGISPLFIDVQIVDMDTWCPHKYTLNACVLKLRIFLVCNVSLDLIVIHPSVFTSFGRLQDTNIHILRLRAGYFTTSLHIVLVHILILSIIYFEQQQQSHR